MDEGNIFKEQGRPVKFFLQKDLAEEVIKELTAQITANGGSVEDKVPLQGFVLVEPMSGEGKRLNACWSTADRPLRCFVPPTFVPACLRAGKLLPQPFRDRTRGEPKRIHIHPSITNERLIETLSARIWNSGGDPTATESEADVIIAEEGTPVFQNLILRYDQTRHKFVESPAWVKECIELGIYRNTPSVKKNFGGRIKGSRRTEFSEADDRHLAHYIATRLPDPNMRGRTGNKMYEDLCSRTDLYPWADRHPWQSWRERYKNNVPRFSQLIDSFVKLNPAAPDGKGLHGFVRVSSSPAKGSQKKSRKPTSSDGLTEVKDPVPDPEWGGSQWEVRVGNSSPPAWGKGKRKAEEPLESPEKRRNPRVEHDNAQGSSARSLSPDPKKGDVQVPKQPIDITETGEVLELEYPGFAPDAGSLRSLTRSRSPDSNINNMEAGNSPMQPDSDDADIGPETQELLTASREMLANPRGARGHSEAETSTQELENFLLPPSHISKAEVNTAGDIAPKALDAGQVLVQIACKYRFLLDEVKEVYGEQKGDVKRTIAFFEEAREALTEKRTTWKLIAGRVTREPEESE